MIDHVRHLPLIWNAVWRTAVGLVVFCTIATCGAYFAGCTTCKSGI